MALAVGDTEGFYDALSGLTGNLTVSTVNVTNPAAPALVSTLVTSPCTTSLARCKCSAAQGHHAHGHTHQ